MTEFAGGGLIPSGHGGWEYFGGRYVFDGGQVRMKLTAKFYSDASGSLKVRVREDGRVWVLDSWSGPEWVELQDMDVN